MKSCNKSVTNDAFHVIQLSKHDILVSLDATCYVIVAIYVQSKSI